jgi:hypothetical protein
MYDTILPVTPDHNPIIVEGDAPTQLILTNAGPATVEVSVWEYWRGKHNSDSNINSEEPDLRLELRPGNQRIISGRFMRVNIKEIYNNAGFPFAALGAKLIYKNENELR